MEPTRAASSVQETSARVRVAGFGRRKSGERHTFRASLPSRTFSPLPMPEPEVLAAMARIKLRSDPVDWKRLTVQDAKDFLLAYCACFVALMAFLS